LLVAPSGGVGFDEPSGDLVRGDAVVGRGSWAEALPGPATTLVVSARPKQDVFGRDGAWSDRDGILLSVRENRVFVAVDPEDPRGDWARDPSFPALVA